MKTIKNVNHRPSLGTQLLVLGIGMVLSLSLAFTWINTQTQSDELKEVFTEQAKALAYNLAVSSNSHLLEKDFAVIETLLLKADGFQDLYSGTITDPQGQVLAQVARDDGTDHLSSQYGVDHIRVESSGETRLLLSERFLTVIEPIKSDHLIGLVILEFDLSPLQTRQAELIERNVLLAAVLIFPAALVLWLFIRKTILELRSLTDFAQVMVKEQGVQHEQQPASQELAMLHTTLNWASATLHTSKLALEAAKLKADKSNDLKSQFVANMSHEIRTPLNGILGMTEVTLGNQTLPEQARGNLELIHQSAEHLLRVVNDILDFSKIDANRLDMDPQPFSLRAAVQATVNMVQSAYAKPGVDVVLNISPALPDRFVGDCPRIMQVLNNLLSNAMKFTEQGQVTLDIALAPDFTTSASENCRVHFAVRDTGTGISESARSEIFKAFSQAEPGTARKYGGTGLGLTITQRLLELMGSHVHLWSEEGLGSEFSFVLQLPLADSQSPPVEATINAMQIEQHDDTPTWPEVCKGLRVLVAEDNKVNQTFISHVLTQLGVSFRFADDGLAAVQAVEEETFDLVFMDMHMPNMGGLEACKVILSNPNHHKLPIVGLTADAIADTRESCIAAGMRDYISKPFKRSDIENALNRLGLQTCAMPMQNFDHDRELLKTTANLIATEMPALCSALDKSLQTRQLEEAKRVLHTVKGHCKLIGETEFAGFVQQLENQLGNGELPGPRETQHLLNNLKVLHNRLDQIRR